MKNWNEEEEFERGFSEKVEEFVRERQKKERAKQIADKYINRDGTQPPKHGPADQKEIDRLARLPTFEFEREREAVFQYP